MYNLRYLIKGKRKKKRKNDKIAQKVMKVMKR